MLLTALTALAFAKNGDEFWIYSKITIKFEKNKFTYKDEDGVFFIRCVMGEEEYN